MTVSTHILDASRGIPAARVPVLLARLLPAGLDDLGQPAGPGTWEVIENGQTGADGRHRFAAATRVGAYRLTFTTGAYFVAHGDAPFYPEVTVTFAVLGQDAEQQHFHLPLLMSPFAYSTYRGS